MTKVECNSCISQVLLAMHQLKAIHLHKHDHHESNTRIKSAVRQLQSCGRCGSTCLNRSRIRAAPSPANISTNSEATMDKKLTPHSPATALAIKVLPQPGGPTIKAPLGCLAPAFVKRPGFRKKSTISCISYCRQKSLVRAELVRHCQSNSLECSVLFKLGYGVWF